MYAYFNGTVADIEDETIVIDVNNIGYRIYVTKDILTTSMIGSNIKIYTYTSVREDAFILFGFKSKSDLALFKQLITVSGVGPKMGLAILSAMDNASIKSAIITQDAKLLSHAPGVGAKTANRIILELKDKISVDEIISIAPDNSNSKILELRQECYEALIGLGISAIDASKAINEVEINEDSKIETLIRQLLAKI